MSSLAVSQIEKHFITNEIYKRSRRYFDVIKLKSIEHNNSKSRRKPAEIQKQQIQQKIDQNFMSSQVFYNNRRVEEIQKSKKRNSFSEFYDDKDEIQTNYSVVTPHNTTMGKKGFDMGKVLPREFYENLHNHSNMSIQDTFDSFVTSDFSKGQKRKAVDFNKILGRKDTSYKSIWQQKSKQLKQLVNPQQTYNNSSYITQSSFNQENIGKAYDKFFFDQSRFKCLIDVEKQRKAQHRKSLKNSLKMQPLKDISIQRIEKGRNFSVKKPTPSSLMFYYGKGKDQLSQMHLRTLKTNQNYWIEQLRAMKKEDFQTVKRRESMVENRKHETAAKKIVIDQRGQVCDAMYFLRLKKQ